VKQKKGPKLVQFTRDYIEMKRIRIILDFKLDLFHLIILEIQLLSIKVKLYHFYDLEWLVLLIVNINQ
jgi:hypothetical protein